MKPVVIREALFCLFLAGAWLAPPALRARTWTEAATGRTMEAEFVRADGTFAVVRRADGMTANLPLARLSEADQAFVREQSKSTPTATAAPSSSAPISSSKSDSKESIIGTWEGFMANSDGSPHGEIKLVVTEREITATNPRGEQVMGAGRYSISGGSGGGKGVRRIDAEGTSGQFAGRSYEGIFTIEGKTLKWCSANDNPNSTRPEELKSDPPSGHFLMVLERKD